MQLSETADATLPSRLLLGIHTGPVDSRFRWSRTLDGVQYYSYRVHERPRVTEEANYRQTQVALNIGKSPGLRLLRGHARCSSEC